MSRPSSKTAAELTTLMMYSPFIITTRMTQFWLTAASPTAKSKREAARMVTEKMQAMGESAMAMNVAMTKVAMDAAVSAVTGAARSGADEVDEVLSAGLKPYSKRVRANRKRLGG